MGRELASNGYRVSVGKDEKILEMDDGDGCTMNIPLMPLCYPLNTAKMTNVLYILL